MILPVALLAGGLATRLGELSVRTPKALLPVGGEPFINHQLRLLRQNGIKHVVICAGYLGEMISAHVGDGNAFNLSVSYSFDWPDLLGTGGALKKALPQLGDDFMVLYGDSYLPVDYEAVARAFTASGKPALMTVYHNDGRYDTSNVLYRDGNSLLYDKQNPSPEMRHIDYGLGCLSRVVLEEWPVDKFDLADVYAALSKQDALAGYEVLERFYEIGSRIGLIELNTLLTGKIGKEE